MASVSNDESLRMPRLVVVGNQKGGCGKSTLAMHMIVALLKIGKKVASMDLDLDQMTLTRYIDNRRSWSREKQVVLEMPDHCSMTEADAGVQRSYPVDLARFISHLQTIEHERSHDFVVIDTPGGLQKLAVVAHGIADTIITPINDSLLDIDVIVKIDRTHDEPQPSNYSRMVARARETRHKVCGLDTDWVVVRNRMVDFGSSNERQVIDILEYIREQFGFRTVPGLRERATFRELFPAGLTVFDPLEISNLKPENMASESSARSEMYALIEESGLVEPESIPESARRIESEDEMTRGDALIRFAPPALRSAAAAIRSRRAASRRRRGT